MYYEGNGSLIANGSLRALCTAAVSFLAEYFCMG